MRTRDHGSTIDADDAGLEDCGAGVSTAGVMLTGVHDLVLRGFTVRASAGRGIWIDEASSILIDRATVANPAGVGIQIKRGTSVTITNSRLINNSRAGLLDMSPAHGTTLRDSLVSANGHDGQRYNGDGVELNSSGATVTGNTITHNGDGVAFEHGIYAGATANHYAITGNTIGANAGADVKAEGRGWWQRTGSTQGCSASCCRTTRWSSRCSTTSSRVASSTASC
jgi:Right handed beta helix region